MISGCELDEEAGKEAEKEGSDRSEENQKRARSSKPRKKTV